MARNSHFARAFTLIELLVVLAVIAILMSLTYPVYTGIQERAKVTKDMNNLRQIGVATQTYVNDHDGVLPGSTTDPVNGRWMSQLNTKYLLGSWRVFQSAFDTRSPSESGGATTRISYGINFNVYPGGIAISADKITKPTAFILFAPAQDNSATTNFQGNATTAAPGVTLFGNANTVTSTPGGVPTGGTHNSRTRINALFADLHCETMPWSGTGPAFTNTTDPGSDPDAPYRWSP